MTIKTALKKPPALPLPTLENVVDAVFRVDLDFNIQFVSEPGVRWLAGDVGYEFPKSFLSLLHPDDVEEFRSASSANLGKFSCGVGLIRSSGESWVNLRGSLLPDARQLMLCVVDISAWKTSGDECRHAPDHDALTGLPNRLFIRRAIEEGIRAAGLFSIALIDLDGFKRVNDTFGHTIGDEVLVETAKRLAKIAGSENIIARLNGDQFVLLAKGRNALQVSEDVAEILYAVARPYDTAPHDVYLSASIGIAAFPEHGRDFSKLLRHADTAMFFAKNSGRNRVSIYQDSKENDDFSIRGAIHRGLQENEFTIEYQPQFNMARRIVGAEALMRWTSHDFGKVPPDKFIPIVENAGLISYLGKWALRYSCHQLRRFQEKMPDFVMSVNVSPLQFCADDFVLAVIEGLEEANVDPATLILEITESTLMHSQEKTERALTVLRDRGVRFSIDDFGTGFSSLAYLTRLPVSNPACG